MDILFLGTGAAEGYPHLFCDCDHCEWARRLEGRNLRLRSSLLVNEDLLIDCGPDLLAAAMRYGLHLSRLTTLLVTHFDDDHFYYVYILCRSPELPLLRVYAGPRLKKELAEYLDRRENWAFEIQIVEPYKTVPAGRYEVQTFRANHTPQTDPLFYSIRENERTLLYATDTGPLTEETWDALTGLGADVVVMEETMGGGSYEFHMGMYDFLATKARMVECGVTKPDARFFAHHISHGNPPHDALAALLRPHAVEVAYDGLRLTV